MTTLLLLHSALGLRPAVHRLADRVRSGGHTVLTPDLFDGRTFGESGYAAAVAFSQAHRPEVQARADAAFASVEGPLVVGGFSMGSGIAQVWAQESERVLGAVLVGGGGIYDGWTPSTWRAGVPLTLHHAVGDPWMDAPELAALVAVAARSGADVSDHVYPSSGHLFFDEGLTEEFDEGSADLLVGRMLAFLDRFS